jgi:hypothetical protein
MDTADSGGVRSEVLTAVTVKNIVFWDIMLCTLVEVYRRFRGMYCLQVHG